MRSAHDPELEREGDRLRATSRTELHKDTLKMPIHGPLADAERPRDLLGRFAKRDLSEDLDLSPRKRWTHGLLLRRHRKK
jgi:hypothetical protein